MKMSKLLDLLLTPTAEVVSDLENDPAIDEALSRLKAIDNSIDEAGQRLRRSLTDVYQE